MTIQLRLRQELVSFLAQIPRFQSRRGRQALLLNAGLEELAPTIDWEGSSKEFLSLLIDQLDRYGALSNGRDALLSFLEGIESEVGVDHREELKSLYHQLLIEHAAARMPPKHTARVEARKAFVSSTIVDLYEFHEAVRYEIERHSQFQYLGSLDERSNPLHSEIAACDLFIGIYAQSYGTILEDGKSILEQEYDIAQELDKKRICFVLSDDAYWKVKHFDLGEGAEKLAAFKKRIAEEENIREFSSKSDLVALVRESIEAFVQSESVIYEDLRGDDLSTIETLYRKGIAASCNQFPTLDPKRRLTIAMDYIPLSLDTWPERCGDLQHIDFILNQAQKLVVLGLPGTGKTTLLRCLAFEEGSKQQGAIPIYVRLARFSMTSDELADYLLKEIKQYIGKSAADRLASSDSFLNGRYLVLLDGMDEVKREDYEEVVHKIHGFAAEYRNCQIVITSRVASFQKAAFEEWSIYQLNPLSLNNIRDFVHNWFSDSDQDPDALTATIQVHKRLLELAQVPFLLVMICHTYENEGRVYKVRSRLYQRSIEYMLGLYDWDPERQKIARFEQRQQFQTRVGLLSRVAFHFYQLGQKEFTQEELELVIRKNLAQDSGAGILLSDFLEGGILQFAGDSYFFLHRTMWEYFVALALRDRIPEEISIRAANPYWEEPLRLCAGLTSDPEVVEAYIEELWIYNKPLALRAAMELEEGSVRLLSQLLSSASTEERLLLVASLRAPSSLSAEARKRLVIETVEALFTVETDCEVLHDGIKLLEEVDQDDETGIVRRKFDLDNAEARLLTFLNDSQYLLDFVEIEGGAFQMGNPDKDRDNDKPIHPVRVSTFCMGRYPVTNRLFREFPFISDAYREHYMSNDNKPVTRVTWFEATLFCRWLGCRLPTEAEWEYACRAGTETRYFFGDDSAQLDDYGWYYENSGAKTHLVGEKKANPFGLFDIIGNVWEMCQDWYDATYYSSCLREGMVVDPQGPESGEYVVHRSGSYNDNPGKLRCGYRSNNSPKVRSLGVGFRLCFPGRLVDLREG